MMFLILLSLMSDLPPRVILKLLIPTTIKCIINTIIIYLTITLITVYDIKYLLIIGILFSCHFIIFN